MTKLKPCPFCGGEAKFENEFSAPFGLIAGGLSSVVVCTGCGASGERYTVSVKYSSDEKAAEAWNRRER